MQQLLAAAKQLDSDGAEQAADAAVELAAVQEALQTHVTAPAPENMFCPFTIVKRGEGGQLQRSTAPMLHWGNVDTGSMVNIVYSGVLRAFPHLHQYHQPFEHVVKGVADKLTKVTGKLVGVPISLGMEQRAGTCVKTTFYVLQCESYHFILGLTLLALIDGGVFCGSRRLEYTLGPAGKGERVDIPLATRSTARQSPCYTVQPFYAPPDTSTPHSQLTCIPEVGWKSAYLGAQHLPYVEEGLVALAAWATCNNATSQYLDCLPPAATTHLIDCSQPIAPSPPSPRAPTDPSTSSPSPQAPHSRST